ncbi:MAG: PQQ-dependent sugar dehydrogenase [Alphaproteobacteria bacterium]|nr:PQQ-dependent sugar dehydrogenase [Alphaproteobacteria bacterium]
MRATQLVMSVSSLALLGLAGLGIAGCTSDEMSEPGAAPLNTPQQTGSAPPSSTPMPSAPLASAPAAPTKPVSQGEPNKKDARPAFAEQTRAPESVSGVKLNVQTVASGLSEPWAMALLPDGALLVTERTGKLWTITPTGQKSEVTGVPIVDNRDQGGLLDISVGPDFTTSRTIYFTFSEARGEGKNGTSLGTAKLSADGRKLENARVIFQQTPAIASTKHYGSNIEWDSAGNLYLTLGERSDPQPRVQAQDKASHLGKVLKLTAEGKPAEGNPFVGQAGAKPEIWSTGHRNVQGAAMHLETGKLWTIEHGPRGGDEINIPEGGKNYGWPVITYGIDYPGGPIGEGITSRAGMEQPVYYWDPVISPGDMTFYRGDLFPWKGDLLVSALRPAALVRLEVSGDRVTGEERLLKDQGRIRDIQEAADGAIWAITDESNGKLLRLTPG